MIPLRIRVAAAAAALTFVSAMAAHAAAPRVTARAYLVENPRTGEVVLDTTRSERGWNLAGSVLHWIYPTILRRNWALWDGVVWTLTLSNRAE